MAPTLVFLMNSSRCYFFYCHFCISKTVSTHRLSKWWRISTGISDYYYYCKGLIFLPYYPFLSPLFISMGCIWYVFAHFMSYYFTSGLITKVERSCYPIHLKTSLNNSTVCCFAIGLAASARDLRFLVNN